MGISRKKALVTGAAGFIGSHLVEGLLKKGYDVKAFVHYNSRNDWGWIDTFDPSTKKQVEVVTGDLRDPFVVKKAVEGCAKVFHLGALIAIPYSYRAPQEYVQTNITGTLNICQSALELGVERVLHTSTSEVYGTAQYVPIDEKHPLQGQSPYSASKIGADKIAESYHLSFQLPVTTIRPFNTYGPRQSSRAIIPTIISQALTQDKIKLGSLTPVRDLNYVQDTVNGFITASETPATIGHTYNLAQGMGITVGELAQKILKILKIEKPIVSDDERVRPENSEVLRLIGASQKALTEMNWKPETSLDTGLTETIHWIQKNIQYFKTDIYNV
jgi:NAD dependent epimerase/dehydratase